MAHSSRLPVCAVLFFALVPGFAAPKIGLQKAGVPTVLMPGRDVDAHPPTGPVEQRVRPIFFEKNVGQFPSYVRYMARSSRFDLVLGSDGPAVLFSSGQDVSRPNAAWEDILSFASRLRGAPGAKPDRKRIEAVRLIFAGGATRREPVQLDRLSGAVNYLIGNDPARWHTGIPIASRVEYQDVWPGVSVVFYWTDGTVEYDLVLSPGADPSRIAVRFEGADRVALDDRGNVEVLTHGRRLLQVAPSTYQERNGVRASVPGEYVLKSANEVGVRFRSYDASRLLVVDPVLDFATYQGGVGNEMINDIAVDAAGNSYVTGSVTSGIYDNEDVLVSKLSPDGSTLIYSTRLGGYGRDVGTSIAIDAAGRAVVGGWTDSTNFPAKNALQAVNRGKTDAFVVRLGTHGSTVTYSTYLGGRGIDIASGVAIDAEGYAYVAGRTESSDDFPVKVGSFDTTFDIKTDGFVAKLVPDGSAFVYSTFLGGASVDFVTDLAVDSAGCAYAVGSTNSQDFPIMISYQADHMGGGDCFVTKLSSDGTSLLYSTYVGGRAYDEGTSIALPGDGTAYVAGTTYSADFPTYTPFQPNPYQGSRKGAADGFVLRMHPRGSGLLFSTLLGGSGVDSSKRAAAGRAGVWVAGTTQSADFPVVRPLVGQGAIAECGTGGAACGGGFLTRLTADGSAIVISTYLGVLGSDNSIATDAAGHVYVAGGSSGSLPSSSNAFQKDFGGGNRDGFVARLSADLFAPQIAWGGGYITKVVLPNPGVSEVAGTIYSTGSDGSPAVVNFEESGTGASASPDRRTARGSSVPFVIPAGGARILRIEPLDPSDRVVHTGWLRVESGGDLRDGVAVFEEWQGNVLKSSAGVMLSEPLTVATIPVGNSASEEALVGFAAACSGAAPISLRLILVRPNGFIADDRYPVALQLSPGQQIAVFLHQLLAGREDFKGSMVLVDRDGQPFLVTALLLKQGRLTAIPVVPRKAPHVAQ